MKYHIPEPALENHVGFLGGTGSGKTTAAKREIAERKLKEGKKVIIIDPTDVWWGLRLKADGEGKGFPIHIFGGRHQDFPLRAQDAEVLADAFATSSDSAIFVTKDMTVSERTMFFTKFAEVLLRKNRGAVYLIIDESHIFLPQAGLHISLGNIVTFLESKAEEPTVTVTDVKITRPPKRAALQVADDITGAMRQPLKVDVKEFMRPEKAVTGDTTLRPAHREILTILAQNSGYDRTMKKLAIFAGKAMSGGFRNYVYFLNGAGLIEKRGEAFFITDAGLKALGSYTPLPTGRDLAEHWKRQLRPAEAEILQHVIDVAPKYISMADLAAACGKAVTGGFRNYVYHLCSLELISGSGSYTISEDLL
jgi:hypothetical protein